MEPIISWVHVSDVHFGHGTTSYALEQKLVAQALVADLRELHTRDQAVPAPDVLFVTGDVAFSGATRSETEYADARVWLGRLGAACGVPSTSVFVVPGNHDVQRSADKDADVKRCLDALRSGTTSIDDVLLGDDAVLRRRQENFSCFAGAFAPVHVGGPQLFWRHPVKPHSRSVQIVGLNTALLAADDTDKGNLRVGQAQLVSTLGNFGDDEEELVIVLMHHPMSGGWLVDESNVAGWLRRLSHVQLSGHVHLAASRNVLSGAGNGSMTISAGAVHGDPSETNASLGYSIGSVGLEDGAWVLRVWPRIWSPENKDFRTDVHSVPPGRSVATHVIKAAKKAAQSAASTTEVTTATLSALELRALAHQIVAASHAQSKTGATLSIAFTVTIAIGGRHIDAQLSPTLLAQSDVIQAIEHDLELAGIHEEQVAFYERQQASPVGIGVNFAMQIKNHRDKRTLCDAKLRDAVGAFVMRIAERRDAT